LPLSGLDYCRGRDGILAKFEVCLTKTALITGVTGQDGAYLTELLLQTDYSAHGVKRRASLFNTDRIEHLYQDPHETYVRLQLHYGDLSDSTNLIRIIQEVQPDEIYNLAAQSHVAVSF
jgi:GDPmannose 4,6-dehydratase